MIAGKDQLSTLFHLLAALPSPRLAHAPKAGRRAWAMAAFIAACWQASC